MTFPINLLHSLPNSFSFSSALPSFINRNKKLNYVKELPVSVSWK